MTNKIFDFDGRTGQLIDQVNSSDLINNNVRIHNGEKGLCGKFNKVNTSLLSTCGTGTNPILDNTYTTSKYSVLDFDVGDRITNILTKKGIGV